MQRSHFVPQLISTDYLFIECQDISPALIHETAHIRTVISYASIAICQPIKREEAYRQKKKYFNKSRKNYIYEKDFMGYVIIINCLPSSSHN